jgi:glucose/arabinose dehydrogenase
MWVYVIAFSNKAFDFTTDGTCIATGIRNSLALAFDSQLYLWSVDNGADNITRTDLMADGTSIRNDNPSDELNFHTLDDIGQPFG